MSGRGDKRAPPWGDDADKLAEWWDDESVSVEEIARRLDRTVGAVRLRASQLSLGRKATTPPPYQRAKEIQSRLEAGLSYRKIAEEFGCATESVRLAAIRLGLSALELPPSRLDPKASPVDYSALIRAGGFPHIPYKDGKPIFMDGKVVWVWPTFSEATAA